MAGHIEKRRSGLMVILAVGLIVASLYSLSKGALTINLEQVIAILISKIGINTDIPFSDQEYAVIWIIRFPRVLLSLFVGSILAITGVAMQGLFRNPLADPSIIGISTGAALAAALVIVLGGAYTNLFIDTLGLSVLSSATFLGAVLSTLIIFRIAKEKRKTNVATMLLAGIALNALNGAVIGLLTYIANDEQLRDLTFWTLGSLGGASWIQVGIMAAATITTILLLMSGSKSFNALSLGEQEAMYVGTHVEHLKWMVILATGLAIGCTVAFCGVIGFVGLVVPHILRLLGGANHHFLLPASAIGGALLLCVADTISRTIAAPAEIPIGIITSLAGAPVFIYLLYRQRYVNH